ncbi:hypothetical protein T09_7778 [Trichinella sp. T9]|nr:hypothetical protein T09_7778 [Trichinella sp. T9]
MSGGGLSAQQTYCGLTKRTRTVYVGGRTMRTTDLLRAH